MTSVAIFPYPLTKDEINFCSENHNLTEKDLFRRPHLKMSGDSSPTLKNYPLSKEQINTYWDQGYLVLRKLYDVPTLNLFRDRFVEICKEYETSRKHYSVVKDPLLFKKNVKPELFVNKVQELLYDEVYMKYSEDPKILDVVTQLVGEDLTAVNCMLINKPPGTARHPSHQDLYYFPFRPSYKIVASWTAMDRITMENGCLYVVPHSHKPEILYPHAPQCTEKKQFFHGILSEDVLAPEDKRVHLIMEPGDTVFFHPYLIHGSGANVSQNYRKAMTAHYANSHCYYIDVKGTAHEPLAKAMEDEMRRRGLSEYSWADIIRIKSKPVKGVRSTL